MDITDIIIAAAVLIITIGTSLLIKTARTDAKRAEALKWVGIAVNAVEQMAGTASGKRKKDQVKTWLAKQGLIYDEDKLDMAIEAEVRKMQGKLRPKE